MLIEYKFKFEKNGLTVTQQVGSGASGSYASGGPVVEQNSLRASFRESQAANVARPGAGGNGFSGHLGGGGGRPSSGTAPVTLIGPFIMCCPCDDPQKEQKK